MRNRAGEADPDDQSTDALVVSSLFAELERINADGSWEPPDESAETRRKARRFLFWRRS